MTTRLARSLVLSLSALAPAASGQVCSMLAVDQEGTLADGGRLTFDVTGSRPDAFVVLAVSKALGTSCVPVGMMQEVCLDVDLEQALVLPIGQTDTAGGLELAIDLPPAPKALPPAEPVHFQVVSFVLDTTWFVPVMDVCVSNVVSGTLE